MKEIEPRYKCPCSQTILRHLRVIEDELKSKIQRTLDLCEFIALDTDCWTSRSQEGYMNVNAHIVNNVWEPQIFTLSIQELSERHTAENLSDSLQIVAAEWQINTKIVSIVHDNASNIVVAVDNMMNVESNSSCAAHTINLAVRDALKQDDIFTVLTKGSKIVSHFHHYVIASQALAKKQEQLGLPQLKLIQSVRTRWNSDLHMIERLVENRGAIMAVLADRTVTTHLQVKNLEVTEHEWRILENLIPVLKPLEFSTAVLSGAPASMVRPIIRTVIVNHLSSKTEGVSKTLAEASSTRFQMKSQGDISIYQKASFLDPRHKDLEAEPILQQAAIRKLIELEATSLAPTESESNAQTSSNSVLDFLFKKPEHAHLSSAAQQVQLYLCEPQIDINMDPFQWWKSHEKKFPQLTRLAKKYLCIPATSVASERTFSTAGNIVSPQRSCLASENVSTNVFIFQNKFLLQQ
ncbi:Zinc finger BED domain-containing protein [Ooceraea biroi]|uniref:Zinc finger BED domain-containing protein n=2 Tax=Ooceraea biroi TaxID=2015173 RepID=A0A026WRY3_OOCBI|nr:Zinc finger BED domain-containing protein [Ooceraea biroi]